MTMPARLFIVPAFYLAFLFAVLPALRPSNAQAARIADFSAVQNGTAMVLTYELQTDAPKANVSLLLRLGERLLDPRGLHVSGDVGPVAPGPGKRIVWDAGRDFPGGLAGAVDGELMAADLVLEPVSGLSFVSLDGECFEMGCGPWSPACESDEQPVFPACPGPFAMGVTAVTTRAFADFLNDTARPGLFTGIVRVDGQAAPAPGQEAAFVGGVSRDEAQAYADWLSARTGKRFALPSEAQWEYACRSGGRHFAYASPDGRMAGHLDAPVSAPSGKNPLGLCDMSGGVWEWTAGAYSPYPLRDGTTGETGVLRGGRLGSSLRNARCVNRYERPPQAREASSGFRLVLLP